MQRAAAAALAALGLLLSAGAGADEIQFKNGDRLSGTLVSVLGGKLVIDSTVAGKVEVDVEDVRTFSTDESIEIHTGEGEGEVLIGPAYESGEEGSIRTAEEDVEGQVIAIDEKVRINPPYQEAVRWSGSLAAGATFERSDTIKNKASAELHAERATDGDDLDLTLRYLGERSYARVGGIPETTDRNYYAEGLYDHFVTEKWFWFASVSGERDGPSDIDLRFIPGAGVGYRWLNRPTLQLRTRLGLSWVSENYGDSSRDDERWSALVSWTFMSLLRPDLRFTHKGSYVPSLEDSDVALIKTDTALRYSLSSSVFFEGKLLWELDTEPAPGKQRQDVTYILLLGYEFK